MRRDEEYFGQQALELVYIARRLKDALALEGLLTAQGVDYLVEVDTYVGGFLFRSARAGAFFYVPAEARARALEVMLRNGYRPYEPMVNRAE